MPLGQRLGDGERVPERDGAPASSMRSAGTVRAPPNSSASIARDLRRVEPAQPQRHRDAELARTAASRAATSSSRRGRRSRARRTRRRMGHLRRPRSPTRALPRSSVRNKLREAPAAGRSPAAGKRTALARRVRAARGARLGRPSPEFSASARNAGVIQRLTSGVARCEDGRTRPPRPRARRGGREMAFDDSGTRTVTRRAMGAEMLDAETELALARAWRDDARREGAAPAGQRLHAARDLHGLALPPLRRADAGPDPGGGRRADEGGGEVRSRPRRALLDLCGLVDQGLDPGLRDAQLVDGADRLDLVAEGALLQPPPRPRPARARGRRRTARCSTATACAR